MRCIELRACKRKKAGVTYKQHRYLQNQTKAIPESQRRLSAIQISDRGILGTRKALNTGDREHLPSLRMMK